MMNENAKHTPGPWAIEGPRTGPTTQSVSGATVAGRDWECISVTRGMETVAICPNQADGMGNQIAGTGFANARLIASAFTLAAENERLKAQLAAANQLIGEMVDGLEVGLAHVKDAVKADGGIDECDIGLRYDFDTIGDLISRAKGAAAS